MDRMVIEHFLRMGYYEAAEKLASKTDIRELTNLDIFQTSRDVEEDLAEHKTTKCILWCTDNKSKLRKINSNIEFQLRVQEFIELIRSNQRPEAVKYSRKYLTAFKEQMSEISEVMALLAYPVNTTIEKYKSLFNESRWNDLVLSFRNENYRLFQLSNQSLLSVAVQAGLSALKTPQCYSANSKNMNCPVCQDDFNKIAANLPYSHCAQSRLICRITGLPLNEHNLPMMLPNGQIFGQLAIPKISKENGVVVCPITNTKFTHPKIEKVFVM
ncbi:MAEA family protein [Megaselia abdita]